jgi:hypothetical protein
LDVLLVRLYRHIFSQPHSVFAVINRTRCACFALQEALLVQKLFRLVFLGLTLADGEQLLVPTLVSLVGKCLTAAQQQRDPLAYLQLLRILFKHCHASRWVYYCWCVVGRCWRRCMPWVGSWVAVKSVCAVLLAALKFMLPYHQLGTRCGRHKGS